MGKRKRAANGEGSVKWNPERKMWENRISVPGTKSKQRRTVSAKTKAELWQKTRKLLADLSGGIDVAADRVTFGEHLDRWLEDSAATTVKPSTLIRYRGLIKNHLKPSLGNIRLKDLNPQHLSSFYAQKLREGLASGTVRQLHAVAGRALKQARQWKLVLTNPAEDASVPKLIPTKQSKALSREDALRLLQAVKDWREDRYALFILAISTGMRQGEILALEWKSVDLERCEVAVYRTVDTTHSPPTFGSTKGGRERSVTLSQSAIEALRVHRKIQLEQRMINPEWKEQDLVFPGPNGDVIRRSVLYQSYSRLLRREGFPALSFHSLRHTTASLLLEAGDPHKSVQELLGHANIAMTMDTYSHITPKLKSDTAQKMDELLS
jgi:integrase